MIFETAHTGYLLYAEGGIAKQPFSLGYSCSFQLLHNRSSLLLFIKAAKGKFIHTYRIGNLLKGKRLREIIAQITSDGIHRAVFRTDNVRKELGYIGITRGRKGQRRAVASGKACQLLGFLF